MSFWSNFMKSEGSSEPPVCESIENEELITKLKDLDNFDYLNVNDSKKLEEDVKLSFYVQKVNKREKKQERDLIITNKAIYNFEHKKYKDAKRDILLSNLRCVIYSNKNDQMIFQVTNGHDYRYEFPRRADVIKVLSESFEEITKKKLPIYQFDDYELRFMCLSKEEYTQLSEEQKESKMLPITDVENDPMSFLFYGISTNVNNAPKEKIISYGFKMPTCKKEGWVSKKKGQSNKWEHKYVVISEKHLVYYSVRIKGNIQIKGCAIETSSPIDTTPLSNQVAKLHGTRFQHLSLSSTLDHSYTIDESPLFLNHIFTIKPQYGRWRPLELAADGSKDLETWISALFKFSQSQNPETLPSVEGWLMKKDPSSQNWRRRYFILKADRLWYYEMSKKGEILFDSGIQVQAAPDYPTLDKQSSFAGLEAGFSFRFNIYSAERCFYMSSENSQDREQWMNTIIEAAQTHLRIDNTIIEDCIQEEYIENIIRKAPTELVTFVFSDVQGSTSLWEKYPDEMSDSLEQHDNILRGLLVKYRGYEVKTEGDAFMVAFFTVLEAILWCFECQIKLLDSEWPECFNNMPSTQKGFADQQNIFNGIRIRMGIHSSQGSYSSNTTNTHHDSVSLGTEGEHSSRENPITGRMDYFGPSVNMAARISHAAHGGQICMSERVRLELESQTTSFENSTNISRFQKFQPITTDLGAHNLKGIKDPVHIYQISPLQLRKRTFPPLRIHKEESTEHVTDDLCNVSNSLEALHRRLSLISQPHSAPKINALEKIDEKSEIEVKVIPPTFVTAHKMAKPAHLDEKKPIMQHSKTSPKLFTRKPFSSPQNAGKDIKDNETPPINKNKKPPARVLNKIGIKAMMNKPYGVVSLSSSTHPLNNEDKDSPGKPMKHKHHRSSNIIDIPTTTLPQSVSTNNSIQEPNPNTPPSAIRKAVPPSQITTPSSKILLPSTNTSYTSPTSTSHIRSPRSLTVSASPTLNNQPITHQHTVSQSPQPISPRKSPRKIITKIFDDQVNETKDLKEPIRPNRKFNISPRKTEKNGKIEMEKNIPKPNLKAKNTFPLSKEKLDNLNKEKEICKSPQSSQVKRILSNISTESNSSVDSYYNPKPLPSSEKSNPKNNTFQNKIKMFEKLKQ